MLKHKLLAQNHGKEFIVGDVLGHCGHNVSRLLENCFVVPMRINASKLAGNPKQTYNLTFWRRNACKDMALPVVLPMHQQVNNSKDCLLIDPRVSGQETVDILT